MIHASRNLPPPLVTKSCLAGSRSLHFMLYLALGTPHSVYSFTVCPLSLLAAGPLLLPGLSLHGSCLLHTLSSELTDSNIPCLGSSVDLQSSTSLESRCVTEYWIPLFWCLTHHLEFHVQTETPEFFPFKKIEILLPICYWGGGGIQHLRPDYFTFATP